MSKKVLMVDDSPTVVEAAYDELNEKGYEVEIAYNGMEALEMLELFIPDIIIMDIEMPKLKGYEAAEQIRKNPKLCKIPLIALTGVSPQTLGDKAKYFDAYLVKPFGFEEMIQLVDKLLNR